MHEIAKLLIAYVGSDFPDSRTQCGFSDIPKVLVLLHQRSQPGVFKLLLSPQLRKSLQVSGDAASAKLDYGVKVEQCAIGVEYVGSGIHVHAGVIASIGARRSTFRVVCS